MMRLVSSLAILLMAASIVSGQDDASYETQAAGRIEALMVLLAGNHTTETIRGFIRANYPPEYLAKREARTIRYMTQLCDLFGGAELTETRRDQDAFSIAFDATGAPAGEPAYFEVFFDKKPPYYLVGIRDTVPLEAPDDDSIKGLSDSEIEAAVRKLAAEHGAAGEFSGAVAIGRGDQVLFEAAHGLANRRYQVPNTIDTKFNMASVSKTFTAVGVVQLMQRGLITPTDTLGMHLPEVADSYQGKVTIHQLLTHTAGTGRMFGHEPLSLQWHWIRTVSEMTELLISEPKLFDPGEEPGVRFEYSNTGFVWLGRLIEVVADQDFYTYMDEHVFKPAGMKHTGWYEQDKSVPNLAVGYTHMKAWGDRPGDELRENTLLLGARGSPAGGGYSTVGDMLKFAKAIGDHTLLDARHTKLLLEPKVQTGRSGGDSYAYGFHTSSAGGITVVGHSGGFNGVGAEFWFYPAPGSDPAPAPGNGIGNGSGYAYIVFSNQDTGATPISVNIRAMLDHRAQ